MLYIIDDLYSSTEYYFEKPEDLSEEIVDPPFTYDAKVESMRINNLSDYKEQVENCIYELNNRLTNKISYRLRDTDKQVFLFIHEFIPNSNRYYDPNNYLSEEIKLAYDKIHNYIIRWLTDNHYNKYTDEYYRISIHL